MCDARVRRDETVQSVLGPRGSNGTAANLEATGTRTGNGGLRLHASGRSEAKGFIYGTSTLRASRERERARARVCVRTGPRGDV